MMKGLHLSQRGRLAELAGTVLGGDGLVVTRRKAAPFRRIEPAKAIIGPAPAPVARFAFAPIRAVWP